MKERMMKLIVALEERESLKWIIRRGKCKSRKIRVWRPFGGEKNRKKKKKKESKSGERVMMKWDGDGSTVIESQ